MNDYFDAFEQQLKTAVPRAARSHRRRRQLARLPLVHLNSLWFLLLIPLAFLLAPPAGLSDASTPVVPRRHLTATNSAHRQTRHRRTPRRPVDLTLLKGLAAFRRRAIVAHPQIQALQRKTRTITPVPFAALLRFAAATTTLGVQTMLISARRQSRRPPNQTAAAAVDLITPRYCGTRGHAQGLAVWLLSHNAAALTTCSHIPLFWTYQTHKSATLRTAQRASHIRSAARPQPDLPRSHAHLTSFTSTHSQSRAPHSRSAARPEPIHAETEPRHESPMSRLGEPLRGREAPAHDPGGAAGGRGRASASRGSWVAQVLSGIWT